MSASFRAPSPKDTALLGGDLKDPYARYRRMREEAAVHPGLIPIPGQVVVTRFAEATAALKHPSLSTERIFAFAMRTPPLLRPAVRPVERVIARMMLFVDGPPHARLRGLANRAFTPRAVEGMRPQIEALADRLLDELAGQSGPVDLIEGYANWLPVLVIADILGADTRDRRRIKRWSDDWALLLSGSTRPAGEVALRGAISGFMLQRYLKALVRRKQSRPGNSLLDELIAAVENGSGFSAEEVVSNALLLLVAGHITTTNLIGNGLLALLRNPDQLKLLRGDPELLPSAVEEFLRYETPLQFTGRIATEDLELNGHPIRAGTAVAIGLGAANRDPEQFPDPDQLDIRRPDNRQLAFGAGVHFCLGAALARLEGQIGIGTVLRRFPGLRLAEEHPPWRNAGTLRGLERLPVLLR